MVDINVIGQNLPISSGRDQGTANSTVKKTTENNSPKNTPKAPVAVEVDKKPSLIEESTKDLRDDVIGGSAQKYLQLAEEALNQVLPQKAPNTRLSIEVDKDSGHTIYKGIDVTSGEVTSQFPSKEILDFISYYREKEGIVLDTKA